MAFLTGGDVKLTDQLKPILGSYNQNAQGSLSDALGRITNQAKTSARASGRVQGQYQPLALNRANSMASQGITNSLGSVLGGVSLKDIQNQKLFEQQMALANEIGDLNSPSTLQEVLAGLGGGADLALRGKGIYDALSRRSPADNYVGSYI